MNKSIFCWIYSVAAVQEVWGPVMKRSVFSVELGAVFVIPPRASELGIPCSRPYQLCQSRYFNYKKVLIWKD